MSKTVTIDEIKPFEKMAVLNVTCEGVSKEVKAWKSDAFFVDLKEGSDYQIEFEQKPNYKDASKIETWIKTVNGKEAKAKGGSGGGGGYRGGGSPADQAAINASVIVDKAMQLAKDEAFRIGGKDPFTEKRFLELTELVHKGWAKAYELCGGKGVHGGS